ncbi:MAG: type I phosphomannose isomerase catalytic subunit [Planctomycetota bacterium]|jgi:hypothetical protein
MSGAVPAPPEGRIGGADLPALLTRPVYLLKPWGGRRMETELGRDDLPEGPVGESWDVSDLPEAETLVDGGPHDGRRLPDVLGRPFPLLVKVLDAHVDLSVQVHPDGEDGIEPKEECWVGLADGGHVATGRLDGGALPGPGEWLSRLERTPIRGDPPSVVHVPPGTIHAILTGALVWEVQTPVDVTWRLDDYGRAGLDGKPRPLHLDEAASVLARGPAFEGRFDPDRRCVAGRWFRVWTHPAGRWGAVPGCVAFLRGGGRLDGPAGAFEVPPGRSVVLTPGVLHAESDDWMLSAGTV